MDLMRSISGMLRLELTSADMGAALDAAGMQNINLYDVQPVDELTVRFSIQRADWKRLDGLCRRRGEQLKLLGKEGIFWRIASLRSRPILVLGLLLIFAAMLFLPSRVFFIQVEGNETIPTRLILEQAELCGIRFGASRREVRSEKMKNALLGAIPELSWAGVNTSGCVATISVRERSEEAPQQPSSNVSSIVATRDGVIRSFTVTKGSALCQTGQAVKAGQVLISGYTDLGLALRATRAEGEVYADTVRDLQVVIPTDHTARQETGTVTKKYSLIIGKKRINFYKGSGILDTGCDKMIITDYLTLPGGFQLPIAIETQVLTECQAVDTAWMEEDAQALLLRFASDYLSQQMVAGQITGQDVSFMQEDGCCVLTGRFRCLEMIGKLRTEEIVN